MRSSIALWVLMSVSSAGFASVGMYSSSPRLDSTVSRGSLVTFNFIPFVNEVDEHDVTVDFSAAPATIESISSVNFKCSATGATAHCTRALFPKNTTSGIKVDVLMPSSLNGGRVTVVGTIRAASGSSYTWSPWVIIPRTFVVSNADGSLAEAIGLANGACRDTQPCEIDFDIPPEESLTIAPETPLPKITARRITIDGLKQVVLDGSRTSSAGLNLTGSDRITIRGLEIRNWEGPGILVNVSPLTSLNAEIADNNLHHNLRGIMSIGVPFLYVHDNVISDNRRSGVWIENGSYPAVYENKIEGNGASGVYFGPGSQFGMADENQIWANRDFGVAIDPLAKWIEVRSNSMKQNGQLGIDFNLDLVTPNVADDSTRPVPNSPVLTSATFDPLTKKTVIIGHVDLRKPADVGYYAPIVDVYRSSALDAHGMAQGEHPLFGRSDYSSPVKINSWTGDFVSVYDGDLTGQYITATYTRMYALGKGGVTPNYYENWQATSEFSAPVRVER